MHKDDLFKHTAAAVWILALAVAFSISENTAAAVLLHNSTDVFICFYSTSIVLFVYFFR